MMRTLWHLIIHGKSCFLQQYVTYAPINVLPPPPPPPPGHIWGYSGDLTQTNVKCPIVGQTYRVKSPPLAPVATRDLLGI